MAADGSVVIEAKLDPDEAEKELSKLENKIEKLQDTLNQKKTKHSALAEEARQIGVEYDEARKKLEYMQSGDSFFTKDHIQEQAQLVKDLETQWDKARQNADKLNTEIYDGNQELEKMANRAADVKGQIRQITPASKAMNSALESAQKNVDEFGQRLKRIVASALVFNVVNKALSAMKNWMSKVILSNDEARASIAKLKGALLTLAQPIVEVIIPAFIALVNVLTRIISVVAQIVSLLFGKTAIGSKQAAKNLDKETKALEGVGSAADDAAGSLAGFDEINTIQTENSGGGGGASTDIAPDFDFDTSMSEKQLENLLNLIELIGAALAAWKISSALGLGMKGFLGILVAVYSAIQYAKGLFDAWVNGVSWGNFMQMVAGAVGVAAGLALAFGPVAAGISLVVTGIGMLITGFHDAMKNGWNLQNTLLSIAGILATGIGIGLITGSFIPALIAGIAGLLLALTVATGHGEELLQGVRDVMQGFLDFFTGIFTGDIDKAADGIRKIVEGLKEIVLSVVAGIKDGFLSFLNWLDQKTNGKFKGIIDFVAGLWSDMYDSISNTLGNIMDAVKTVFGGVVDFIAGVFTADWDRAWQGVKSIFTGLWNGIVSALEGAVNLIITGVNFLIRQLNKVSFSIPDWVPAVGGKRFGFNIQQISPISIPRLAQGAVIPPNREFMAVLGDQSSGNNLEAPESLIRKIVREESGGANTELLQAILEAIKAGQVIKVNETVLGRTTAKAINKVTQSSGKPVLLV
nr:MAG TPA: minor tail protein [Caudoviricetes sp.]